MAFGDSPQEEFERTQSRLGKPYGQTWNEANRERADEWQRESRRQQEMDEARNRAEQQERERERRRLSDDRWTPSSYDRSQDTESESARNPTVKWLARIGIGIIVLAFLDAFFPIGLSEWLGYSIWPPSILIGGGLVIMAIFPRITRWALWLASAWLGAQIYQGYAFQDRPIVGWSLFLALVIGGWIIGKKNQA